MINEEAQNEFNRIFKEIESEQEQYWNSLTKEQQLKCFCAVARRIYEGDIEKQGSYRYVLYQVFDFGPEAYAQAQMAGYLAIHNAIFTQSQEEQLLEKFAEFCGVENVKQKVALWNMNNI